MTPSTFPCTSFIDQIWIQGKLFGGLTLFCFCASSHLLRGEPYNLVSPEPNPVIEGVATQCGVMPARPFATRRYHGKNGLSQPCPHSLAGWHPYKSLGYWMVPCFRPVEMTSPSSASSPRDISVIRLAMQQAASPCVAGYVCQRRQESPATDRHMTRRTYISTVMSNRRLPSEE